MEYNTQRGKMIIPEYGRNVQNMIQFAMTVNEREVRNLVARSIVKVMSQLHPNSKEVTDYKHKLWDHLFVISDFKLDVESPFPAPQPEAQAESPEPVPYPVKSTAHRYYGNILREMITKALELPEGEERNAQIFDIANQMKRSYLTWNKDYVDDAVIFNELRTLSGGQIDVENVALTIQHGIAIKYAPLHTKTKKANKKPFFKNRSGNSPSAGGGFKPYNRKK